MLLLSRDQAGDTCGYCTGSQDGGHLRAGTHTVSRVDGEVRADYLWQLLCDVIVHVEVGVPRLLRSVDVESSTWWPPAVQPSVMGRRLRRLRTQIATTRVRTAAEVPARVVEASALAEIVALVAAWRTSNTCYQRAY